MKTSQRRSGQRLTFTISDCSHHRRRDRAGDEPCRLAADLRVGDLPSALRYAGLQKLLRGDDLCGSSFRLLRRAGHSLSILSGTPVGSTIVAVDIFGIFDFFGISRLGGIRT